MAKATTPTRKTKTKKIAAPPARKAAAKGKNPWPSTVRQQAKVDPPTPRRRAAATKAAKAARSRSSYL